MGDGKLQFWLAVFSLVCLAVSYVYNLESFEKRKTALNRFKLFALVVSFCGLLVWFRDWAKYSVLFMLIALVSMPKKEKNDGKRLNKTDRG